MVKEDKPHQKAKIDIENKIQKANNTALRHENKREGNLGQKAESRVFTPYSKIGK